MKHQDTLVFLLLICLSLLFHYPHFISYKSDTNFDFFLHYNWAKEFSESMMLGDMYPKWMYHGSFGLGEPVLLYYAPLYYWLTGIFSLLVNSTWDAMHLVEILSTSVYSWFIYKTLSYYVQQPIAILAGIVALFNPFSVMLHYKFNGFPWTSMGYASQGLLFWAVIRPYSEHQFINIWAAIAIALAFMSHTVSGLINLICFSFICLVPYLRPNRLTWKDNLYSLLGWLATVFIGLALSAVYLLPAFTSTKLINSSILAGTHTLQAFALPIYSAYKNGVQWFSFQWPISALAAITLTIPTVFFFKIIRENSVLVHRGYLAMSIGLASLFFASDLSYPLWLAETPLRRVTLPYRFVSITYTASLILSCLAFEYAHRLHYKTWQIILFIPIILVGGTGIMALVKGTYGDGTYLPPELHNNNYSFQSFKETFSQSDINEKCASDYRSCITLPITAGGFRGVPEYILNTRGPAWFQYAQTGLTAECITKGLKCQELNRTREGRHWLIEVPVPSSVRLPQFDFPAWKVYIDGKAVPHNTDLQTGVIAIDLPAGRHEITVIWQRLPTEWLGLWISLLTCCGLILLALYSRLRPPTPSHTEATRIHSPERNI